MTAYKSMIDELEEAVASKEIGRRADTLRRITDLFVSGSTAFSDDQIALFDDVMNLLAREIESSARAAFGHRLATLPQAPPKIIRALALDDAIEVAGPVLTQSERIDEATLMEGARTKGQDHLLAISRRLVLTETVTDVLVERGDQLVAQSTAENPGARFSEFGYSTLVKRSENDPELALRMLSRREIPRQHMLKLFADASEAVRLRLEAADHRKASLLREMVAQAANQIQAQTRERSADFVAARCGVQFLQESGKLTKGQLETFAKEGKFDETIIALSLMCDLSIGLVERAMTEDRSEQMLVLAKAIGLTWGTTSALLQMQAGRGSSSYEVEQCLAKFNKLQPETAKKAIQFYRLRERATMAPKGLH
ncbi:MAG: hypothetical protein QOI40_1389 [Alphaproteobacteria bacterium]|jgi:uncharacterized protein (DUF2336 family)|nr:hypothetical protein [Alphaproteobacteria bacterium]